jgi:lambda family phage tail tape measure protein
MATTQANINISVQGQEQINKLQNSLGQVQQAFSNLKTAAVVGGLLALGRSALQSADQISDLSKASGIAIGKLYEFKNAMQATGGEAADMPKAISQFNLAIDEAAGGSIKAQNQFAQLGIKLSDLRTLSEQDIMVKAIAGFDNISSKSEQAGLKMALFGKSFRTVDINDFGDTLEKAAGKGDKYAQSIENAARLQDQLDQAMMTLKTAFLEAFSPVIKLIADFNDGTDSAVDKVYLLTMAMRALAAVIIITFATTTIRGFATGIGALGRAVVAIPAGISAIGAAFATVATGGTVAAGALGGLFRVMGPFMVMFRGIATVVGLLAGIYAASQLFEDFGDIATNVLSRVGEAILSFAATVARLPAKIFNFIMPKSMAIDEDNGISRWLEGYKKDLESARLFKEKAAADAKKATGGDPSKKGKPDAGRDVDTSAIDNLRRSIRAVGDEYDANNIKRREGLKLDGQLIGLSNDQKEIAKAINQIEQERISKVADLIKQRDMMSKENKGNEANLTKEYDLQIERINQLAEADKAKTATILANNAALQNSEQLRLFSIESENKLMTALQDIHVDIEKSGLTTLQKTYLDIEIAATKSAEAAIRAEEGRRGGIRMSREEQDKFYHEANIGTEQLKKAAEEQYNNARSFSVGWKNAFNDYVENATNAANIARDIFTNAAKALEDTLIDAFKTGKVNWKQFLAGVIEDIARAQLKQTIGQIFGLFGGGAKSGGGAGGGILAGLFGGMAKAGQDANQGAKVEEINKTASTSMNAMTDSIKEFGSATGSFLSNMFSGFGTLISNLTSGLGSIISSIGGTLFDVIGSIGGTLFDIIGSLGSGLGDILGSIGGGGGGGGILSTLFDVGASLFGFASGGVIPNNKPVLVGERGPELLFGAGGMGVMSNQDSFGGGSTAITYNINAVDALSFKQMIAQDPTFLYAVTLQGAKGIPNRR